MDKMAGMESQVKTGTLDHRVPKDHLANVVYVEKLEIHVHQEHLDIPAIIDTRELKENQEQLDNKVQ